MSDHVLAPPAQLCLAYGFRYMKGRDLLHESIARVEHATAAITNRNQLTEWVQGPLRALIPHEKALIGFGQISYSTPRIDLAHAVDLPGNYFGAMRSETRYLASPVIANWLERRTPRKIKGVCAESGLKL